VGVEEERSAGTEDERRAAMEMYRKAETAVQIEDTNTAWFEITVGVHQGSELSPPQFAIVMHALNKDMRELLYAVDLAILGNSWEDISQKYVRWKEVLESRGLKVTIKILKL